jgi:hypothetical protein
VSALPYVGTGPSDDKDIVIRGYVQSLMDLNIAQSTVDAMISTGLTGFVTKAYVDTQDGLNATKTYIDAGDATRLKLSQVNVASGAAGLDISGRINSARLAVTSTQRWPKPFISPAAYNLSTVTTSTTETEVYPVAIADPGFTYKLLVMGVANVFTDTDGQWPVVRVRQGSLSGQIIAQGNGLGEVYHPGIIQTYTAAGSYVYTVPNGAGWTNMDIVCLGGGGCGNAFGGGGGNPGVFATASLLYGTTLPGGTTTLNAVVGAGGVYGVTNNGSASVVSGAGITTISGAGGTYGQITGGVGGSPGQIVLSGAVYAGGLQQTVVGTSQPGNPPGGGGANNSGGTGGGLGAPGEIWLVSYNKTISAGGSASVLPTPMNFQTSLTGATTLYVTLSRRSTAASSVSATTVRPSLYVVPIPA